jgi:hypothetical protein
MAEKDMNPPKPVFSLNYLFLVNWCTVGASTSKFEKILVSKPGLYGIILI